MFEKNGILKFLLIFVLSGLANPQVSLSNSQANLLAPIHKRIKAIQRKGTQLSILVQGMNDDTPILSVDPDRTMPSASISKLLTAYAALGILGSTYKFKTSAFIDKSKLKNGVLDAPMVVKGYGDPFLVSERLWMFAERLAASGLKHLKKGILVDQSYFTDYPKFALKQNVKRFSSIPPYLAPLTPTAVNFNTIAIGIFNHLENISDFQVAALPFSDYVDLTHQIKKGRHKNIKISQRHGTGDKKLHVDLKGFAPSLNPTYEYEAILEPSVFFTRVFANMLRGFGIQVEGTLSEYRPVEPIESNPNYSEVSFESFTLQELVRLMIQHSNNFMADSLVFAVGANGLSASYKIGKQRMLEWLVSQGIFVSPEHFQVGSGLSHQNKLSAQVVMKVFKAAWHDPQHGLEFLAALPIAGQNGTLKDSNHLPFLRAKTGNLANTSNLAGILYGQKNKPYFFSLFLHNRRKKNYQLKQDIDVLVKELSEQLD